MEVYVKVSFIFIFDLLYIVYRNLYFLTTITTPDPQTSDMRQKR